MRKLFRLKRFRQKQEEWCNSSHHHHIDLGHELMITTSLEKTNSMVDEGEEATHHSSAHLLLLDEDHDDAIITDNLEQGNQLSNLPADIHLTILSYLDAPSLNSIMCTNRAWCTFLQSPDANRLWLKHCQRIWKVPSNYGHDDETDAEDALWNNLKLTNDDEYYPRRCTCPEGVCGCDQEEDYQEKVPSLHRLLSKTARQQPTTIHPLYFGRIGTSSALQVFHHHDQTLSVRINFEYYNSQQVFVARADAPLARPTKVVSQKNKRLSRIISFLKRKKKNPQWNAFVSPYSTAGASTLYVAPRLVSYFEITVEAPLHNHRRHVPRTHAPEWDILQRLLFLYGYYDSASRISDRDCIVIGLAPKQYETSMDLPGWDEESFGYHSDSGGLYHGFYGMGAAHETIEPFDSGDTVGMGIDYLRRGLFVTKNGKLLGLFFDRLKVDYLGRTDLYPVVGMDSKDTVVVNYGGCGKPFLFDLADYCQKGQQELALKQKS